MRYARGPCLPSGLIDLAYETFGNAGDPPVLIVMGLATQMIGWPDDFCAGPAGRGHFVVRFDNRDIGLSTHLDSAGAADVMAVLGGDASSVPYGLADLADDTVGLLEALGLDGVHVVGASMGGMIAQHVAVRHPGRVRSLTSIMSTTGEPSVAGPSGTGPACPSTAATTRPAWPGSSGPSSPRPKAPATSSRWRCRPS
jgi:pimeloyl-ACP methyl ester carboxylesterase